MEVKEIESAIEGILFAAGDPVGVERLCMALDLDRATVDAVCQRLANGPVAGYAYPNFFHGHPPEIF